MNVPAKLGLYGLGLAVAFAGALGVGVAVGPLLPGAAVPAEHASHDPAADGDAPAAGVPVPAGLQISQDGYTLVPDGVPDAAGEEGTLSFRVLGPDGEPLTAFEESHDKRMHLIVVGRDTTGYQHLHPEMGPNGTWSVPLELDAAGAHRMFADFVPEGGDGLTLGADLLVPGDHAPRPLPAPARTDEVDGYTVALDGDLVAGRANGIVLTVSRDGEPVTDLEPYLGAAGHLVALRGGDLAYLHVHPEGEPGDGARGSGEIGFAAEVPSAGDYRLFLDFRHGGEVRTAAFTVTASDPGGSPQAPAGDPGGEPAPGPEDDASHAH